MAPGRDRSVASRTSTSPLPRSPLPCRHRHRHLVSVAKPWLAHFPGNDMHWVPLLVRGARQKQFRGYKDVHVPS